MEDIENASEIMIKAYKAYKVKREKRIDDYEPHNHIINEKEEIILSLWNLEDCKDVCDLLNNQEETIRHEWIVNRILREVVREQDLRIRELEKENSLLADKLENYKQALLDLGEKVGILDGEQG